MGPIEILESWFRRTKDGTITQQEFDLFYQTLSLVCDQIGSPNWQARPSQGPPPLESVSNFQRLVELLDQGIQSGNQGLGDSENQVIIDLFRPIFPFFSQQERITLNYYMQAAIGKFFVINAPYYQEMKNILFSLFEMQHQGASPFLEQRQPDVAAPHLRGVPAIMPPPQPAAVPIVALDPQAGGQRMIMAPPAGPDPMSAESSLHGYDPIASASPPSTLHDYDPIPPRMRMPQGAVVPYQPPPAAPRTVPQQHLRGPLALPPPQAPPQLVP